MKNVIVMLLVVFCIIGVVFASYDAPPPVKASPDIATFIIQTPAEQFEKHGYSERTAIMYNLARFKELYIESAKQIKSLNDRVKSLEERVTKLEELFVPNVNEVTDPNTDE